MQALESEEGKAKAEHRQRLKLEASLQEVDEKLDRETKVSPYTIIPSQPHPLTPPAAAAARAGEGEAALPDGAC